MDPGEFDTNVKNKNIALAYSPFSGEIENNAKINFILFTIFST
jgi:hypothetical protein